MTDDTTARGDRAKTGRFSARKRKRFLDALAATCNVTLSARIAGVTHRTCYTWRQRNDAFAAAWQAALTLGYERLESAMLEYALAKVTAADIDPDAVDPAALEGSVQQALADRTVSNVDLQFAMALLNRHQAAVEGRRMTKRTGRRATAEETDAALRRKLDALARRVARP